MKKSNKQKSDPNSMEVYAQKMGIPIELMKAMEAKRKENGGFITLGQNKEIIENFKNKK